MLILIQDPSIAYQQSHLNSSDPVHADDGQGEDADQRDAGDQPDVIDTAWSKFLDRRS